jgi:hypothetical protein
MTTVSRLYVILDYFDLEDIGNPMFPTNVDCLNPHLTPPIGSSSSFRASCFEGQWNTTNKDSRMGAVFTDVTGPKEEVTARLVEEQGEWESRALWFKVAKGIRENDFETAASEKSFIEVRTTSFPEPFVNF